MQRHFYLEIDETSVHESYVNFVLDRKNDLCVYFKTLHYLIKMILDYCASERDFSNGIIGWNDINSSVCHVMPIK